MPVLAEADLEKFADGAFVVDDDVGGPCGVYPFPAEDSISGRDSKRSLRPGARERTARGNSTMKIGAGSLFGFHANAALMR